jgi:hypothetical protein
MLTTAHNLVSISTELLLKIVIKLYGENNLKLNSNQETVIMNDFCGIALPKNSYITKHFDRV